MLQYRQLKEVNKKMSKKKIKRIEAYAKWFAGLGSLLLGLAALIEAISRIFH